MTRTLPLEPCPFAPLFPYFDALKPLALFLQGRKLRVDDDLNFESWEAIADVYEEMFPEEFLMEKFQKVRKGSVKLTLDTDEGEGNEGEKFAFELKPFDSILVLCTSVQMPFMNARKHMFRAAGYPGGRDEAYRGVDFGVDEMETEEDDSVDPGVIPGVDYDTPPKEVSLLSFFQKSAWF